MQDFEQQLNLSRKAEADYASAAAAAREVEQKLESKLGEAEAEVRKSQHALASSEAAAAEAERALRDRLAVVEAELVLAREDVSALSGKLASAQDEYHGLAAKNADISLAVGRCLACFRVAPSLFGPFRVHLSGSGELPLMCRRYRRGVRGSTCPNRQT